MSKKKSQKGLSYQGMIVSLIGSFITVFRFAQRADLLEELNQNVFLILIVVSIVIAFIFAVITIIGADGMIENVWGHYDKDGKRIFHRTSLSFGMVLTYFFMECVPYILLFPAVWNAG